MSSSFTLDDFRRQLRLLRQHGGLPAASPTDEGDGPSLESIERITDAMTEAEWQNPAAIDTDGRNRIATASGVAAQDVGQLLAQFGKLQIIMRKMGELRFDDT
jgi:signal recognition particle subunit SRP54